MSAQEAELSGLISRVVPVSALMEEALATALTISGFAQIAVMSAKESINKAFENNLTEGIHSERQSFYALFATMDQKEGMQAFLEKRPAAFKNY